MTLTPIDIHNKEFSKSFRGFNETEVNDFLNQIINDYEVFMQQRDAMNKKLESYQEKLEKFAGIKESLNKSITIAQEAAATLKRNAHSEATSIIRDAEKNADKIINDALLKANKIALESEELKNQFSLYRTKFMSFVENQLKLFASGDWDKFQDSNLMTEGTLTAELMESRDLEQGANDFNLEKQFNTQKNFASGLAQGLDDNFDFEDLAKEYEEDDEYNFNSDYGKEFDMFEYDDSVTDKNLDTSQLDEILSKIQMKTNNNGNDFTVPKREDEPITKFVEGLKKERELDNTPDYSKKVPKFRTKRRLVE